MDAKEQKRKRDREQYAEMSNEKKQEKLRRLREAYQQKKKNKEATQLNENGKQRSADQRAEADILHHEDARIHARRHVHIGGGIEALENVKELHLGKISSILLFSFFSLLHSRKI
jgi:hypothetical protein